MKLEEVVFQTVGLWGEPQTLRFAPGLTLVLGDNEAGKSTTMRALEALLFGVREELVRPRRMAEFQASCRGRSARGEEISFRREGTKLEPEGALAAALPSAWRPRFEALFRLGHAQVRGAEETLRADAALGQVIHAATTGVSAATLARLVETLGKRLSELTKKRQEPGLQGFVAAYKSAREELAARPDLARYAEAREEFRRLERAVEQARGEEKARTEAIRELATLLAWMARFEDLRPLEDELALLGAAPQRRDWPNDLTHAFRRSVEAEGETKRRLELLDNAELALSALARPSGIERFSGEVQRLRARLSELAAKQGELRDIETSRRGARAGVLAHLGARGSARESELADDRALLDHIARELRIEESRAAALAGLLAEGRALSAELSRAEKALREAERRLGEIPEAGAPLALAGFERALVSTRALEQEERALAEHREKLSQACAEALHLVAALGIAEEELTQALSGATEEGVLRALAKVFALSVRERPRLAEAERELHEAEAAVLGAESAIEAARGDLAKAEKELARLYAEPDAPPDEGALRESRAARDTSLTALEVAWAEGARLATQLGALHAYRALVHASDARADARFAGASKIERLAAQESEAAKLRDKLAESERGRIEARTRRDVLEENFRAAWPFLAEPPEEPGRWLDRFEMLKKTLVAASEGSSALRASHARLELLRADVVACVAGELPEVEGLRTAQALEGALAAALESRRVHNQALRDATLARQAREEAAKEATRQLEEARRERETYEARWEQAVRALPAGFGRGEEEVHAALEQRSKLERHAETLSQLIAREEALGTELSSFEREVDDLRSRLRTLELVLPEGLSSLDLVAHLHQEAELARESATAISEAERAITEARKELTLAESSSHRAHEALLGLWTEAGFEGEPDGERIESTAREATRARALLDEIASVERELRVIRPEGREATLEALAGRSRAELTVELDVARERSRELDDRFQALVMELGAAKTALQELESIDAPESAQTLEDARGRLLDELTEAAELRAALWLIQKARERAESSAGALFAEASRYFSILTEGLYTRLLIEDDGASPKLLAELSASSGAREASQLSDGTLDQIWLALRLAVARKAAAETPMPLILDDVFVHFDDARTKAALGLLGELAEELQIVLFTHHDHVAELARQTITDLHLVTLTRPEQREREPTRETELIRFERPEAPALASIEPSASARRASVGVGLAEGSELFLELLAEAGEGGLTRRELTRMLPEDLREGASESWKKITDSLKAAERIEQRGVGPGTRYYSVGAAPPEPQEPQEP